jgi:NAD(P)-dependent dehydrogenase (short-subunit alcohol dehydrogenase family)
MLMDKEFAGKLAIVTGAASGLGRAVAVELARRGADLVLADVNAAGLDETSLICGEQGVRATAVPTDLAQPDACRALVTRAAEDGGRIDALVNVAGLLLLRGAPEVTVEQWDKVFAVNARAPFLLFQAALPHLLQSEGAVVNVVSASALIGHAYLAAYASSKGALLALTRTMAAEFIKSPLRINAVAPGPMNTPMASGGLGQEPLKDVDIDLLYKNVGMRPMAEPEDLTDIIVYLASPRNRKVHGACISIDQGVTA